MCRRFQFDSPTTLFLVNLRDRLVGKEKKQKCLIGLKEKKTKQQTTHSRNLSTSDNGRLGKNLLKPEMKKIFIRDLAQI